MTGMNNKNIVPIYGISGGLLLVCIDNLLMRFGFLLQSYNYSITGFLGQVVDSIFRELCVFILGVYFGILVPWIFSKKNKDFVPYVVVVGLIAGGLIGFILSLFVSRATYRIFTAMPILVMVISWGLMGLCAYWGGRYACRWEVKQPLLPKRRFFIAVVGIIIFGSPLFLTIKRTDFPGQKASISVRHEWAIKKFKSFYTDAIKYLNTSNVLREHIGDIVEIGPTIGQNSVGSSPGEVLGQFTLETVGKKGKVIATVNFTDFSNKTIYSGNISFNNQVIQLEEQTEDLPEGE